MSSNQQTNDLFPPKPASTQVNYLFLGNPGAGKSTLINCLAGGVMFESGVSYGGGLTKHFQKRLHDGVVYMDTPGLADRQIQETAARAITEALRQSGAYKLFFMVRLENGRVVSDDLATIETVLTSIEMADVPFTIVVNNVKKRQYATMMEKGTEYLKVVTLLNSIKHTTPHIVFIPMMPSLEEEDNVIADLPGGIEAFIRFKAPTVEIPPHAVKEINIADFKEVSEKLKEQQERLRNDNAALARRVAELTQKSSFFASIFSRVGQTASGFVPSPAGMLDYNAGKQQQPSTSRLSHHRSHPSMTQHGQQRLQQFNAAATAQSIDHSGSTQPLPGAPIDYSYNPNAARDGVPSQLLPQHDYAHYAVANPSQFASRQDVMAGRNGASSVAAFPKARQNTRPCEASPYETPEGRCGVSGAGVLKNPQPNKQYEVHEVDEAKLVDPKITPEVPGKGIYPHLPAVDQASTSKP
ncbi:hypothetical protein BBJ28_00015402 [Nothophytophthora sp. Chile5]|nr:hypothetical protein BBJ28_00015402 [Nothophytophthora sp. Chile5]